MSWLRDSYTRAVSGLLFPLHEWLKGHDTVARRRALELSQWLPPEAIAEIQSRRLKAFLGRVAEGVPYYRQLFADLGMDAGAIEGVHDLGALPLLDKSTIRQHTDALVAEGARGLRRFSTGGSSGEPLTFYLTSERVSHDVAAKWRATRWWGVDIGDPEVVLWGSPIELSGQDRIKGLRDRLLRTRLLPAFAMGDQQMDAYLDTIARVRPRMLFGYPSALALLGDRWERVHGSSVKREDRVIFCTGERLYPRQRELLERVFGGSVANGYGSRDAGFIAHECPQGGMHISAEDIIVEIVDDEGRAVSEGEFGEIVVTHLATRDFPFIRYRTGDVAALTGQLCPCGRGLPRLIDIQGRTTDFVVAADGTRMHGLSLIYVLREQPGVSAFRVEQHSRKHITVTLVADDGCPENLDSIIVARFRERLGSSVRVDVDRKSQIPQERSGKYRYVVSHACA